MTTPRDKLKRLGDNVRLLKEAHWRVIQGSLGATEEISSFPDTGCQFLEEGFEALLGDLEVLNSGFATVMAAIQNRLDAVADHILAEHVDKTGLDDAADPTPEETIAAGSDRRFGGDVDFDLN